MTEQQTVTCRSVCERLVKWFDKGAMHGAGIENISCDARLALGQPDSDARSLEIANGRATQYHDEIVRLERLLGEKDRQLDAANKRVQDIATERDQFWDDHNAIAERLKESKRLASEWQKRAEEAEATVAQQNALLVKASTKDATIELGKMTQRAEEAEAKLRELEATTPKLLQQWSENAQAQRKQLEFLAEWLLDRLVERGQS